MASALKARVTLAGWATSLLLLTSQVPSVATLLHSLTGTFGAAPNLTVAGRLDEVVITVVGVVVWLLVLWVGLITVIGVFALLTGGGGRAAVLLRLVAPRAVRGIVIAAIGAGAISGLTSCAQPASGAMSALTPSAAQYISVGPTTPLDLDWPGATQAGGLPLPSPRSSIAEQTSGPTPGLSFANSTADSTAGSTSTVATSTPSASPEATTAALASTAANSSASATTAPTSALPADTGSGGPEPAPSASTESAAATTSGAATGVTIDLDWPTQSATPADAASPPDAPQLPAPTAEPTPPAQPAPATAPAPGSLPALTTVAPTATATVLSGDSLWAIAAAHLPAGADATEIATAWPQWYAANRALIGDNPDLILPGWQLTVPTEIGAPPS